MSDISSTPKFYLPIIGAGIALGFGFGLLICAILINVLGGFSFSDMNTIIGIVFIVLLAGAGPVWIIILSVAGWILHAILVKNTDFEKIPMIFGIALLVIIAALMTTGFILSAKPILDYVTMITNPVNSGKEWLFVFYIANVVLGLIASSAQALGLIGSILLIKY
ncbi:MAG: hypothetical protein ACTSSI_02860 [Candidatus Helarchaeota archaeon]